MKISRVVARMKELEVFQRETSTWPLIGRQKTGGVKVTHSDDRQAWVNGRMVVSGAGIGGFLRGLVNMQTIDHL